MASNIGLAPWLPLASRPIPKPTSAPPRTRFSFRLTSRYLYLLLIIVLLAIIFVPLFARRRYYDDDEEFEAEEIRSRGFDFEMNLDYTDAEERRLQREHENMFLPMRLSNGHNGLSDACSPTVWKSQERTEKAILFAIGITSPVTNYLQRAAIRRTWARWPLKHHFEYRFFLGKPSSSELTLVEQEAEKYQDLIVLDIDETLANNSIKSTSIMMWGSEYCGAYYVFKTEDDVYVNMEKLALTMTKNYPAGMYLGRWVSSYAPKRPLKDKSKLDKVDKTVTFEEYPFKDGPGYNMAVGYGLSRDLAYHVAQTRQLRSFRRFPLEDVNTGLIVAGVLGQDIRRFDIPAALLNNCKEHLILMTPVTPAGMDFLFRNDLVIINLNRTVLGAHILSNEPTHCEGYNQRFPALDPPTTPPIVATDARDSNNEGASAQKASDEGQQQQQQQQQQQEQQQQQQPQQEQQQQQEQQEQTPAPQTTSETQPSAILSPKEARAAKIRAAKERQQRAAQITAP